MQNSWVPVVIELFDIAMALAPIIDYVLVLAGYALQPNLLKAGPSVVVPISSPEFSKAVINIQYCSN